VLVLGVLLALALPVAPAWGHRLQGPEPRVDRVEALSVAAEPAPIPDTPIQFAERRELGSGERFAIDSAEISAILAVAIACAGFLGSWQYRRTGIARVTTALVLGFIVETTPHLVHHSLDADQGASCEALQSAERSQAVTDAIETAPVRVPQDLAEGPLVRTAPSYSVVSPRERAPPA
jgi:hypothetical protein